MTLGGVGLRAYATFEVKTQTALLAALTYSKYQQELYNLIQAKRCEGQTFTVIADFLHENKFLTMRGKRFRNAHVHSILTIKAVRDDRLYLLVSYVIGNFLSFIYKPSDDWDISLENSYLTHSNPFSSVSALRKRKV